MASQATTISNEKLACFFRSGAFGLLGKFSAKFKFNDSDPFFAICSQVAIWQAGLLFRFMFSLMRCCLLRHRVSKVSGLTILDDNFSENARNLDVLLAYR